MAAPHVRVMRRRAQRLVPQDLLNGEQIDSGFQQFRGEGVPQRMGTEATRQPGPALGFLATLLQNGDAQVPVRYDVDANVLL